MLFILQAMIAVVEDWEQGYHIAMRAVRTVREHSCFDSYTTSLAGL